MYKVQALGRRSADWFYTVSYSKSSLRLRFKKSSQDCNITEVDRNCICHARDAQQSLSDPVKYRLQANLEPPRTKIAVWNASSRPPLSRSHHGIWRRLTTPGQSEHSTAAHAVQDQGTGSSGPDGTSDQLASDSLSDAKTEPGGHVKSCPRKRHNGGRTS
jgi:hypothetical protein